jgi:hypothetical protein
MYCVQRSMCLGIDHFTIAPSEFSNMNLHVPVFSVYPHNSMEIVINKGELYVNYEIILLNEVLGTNNVAISVK